MATVGGAKSTLVNRINSLTSSATAKDTIFLAKALKENSSLNNFTFQGAWTATTEYATDDVVTNGGNTYICIAAHTSGSSFSVGSNWTLMAGKGDAGTNGTNGTNGTDGTDGTDVGTGTAGQVLKTNANADGVEWGAAGGIVSSGYAGGDGGSASGGRNTTLGSITSINLTGNVGKRIFISGRTCMNENSNHSDNLHLSVWVKNGANEKRIGSARAYSIGTNINHGQAIWFMSATGIFTLTSTYATTGTEVVLKGGTNGSGTFTYGDAYQAWADGEEAGWNLTWFVA